jgi:signal transduction histidine kinase
VRRAEAAAAVSHALLDADAVMQRVAQAVAEVLGDVCAVRQISEDGRTLREGAVDGTDEGFVRALRELGLRVPITADSPGPTGRAVATGRVVRVADSVDDVARQAHPDGRDLMRRWGVHSLLVAPLRAEGATLGTINVFRSRTPGAFTADDAEFLQDLADRAGLALLNAHLHARLTRATRRAEAAAAVSQALSEARLDEQAAMLAVSRIVAGAFGEIAAVFALAPDQSALVVSAVHSDDERLAADLRAVSAPLRFNAASEGIAGRSIALGKVVRVVGGAERIAAQAHPASREYFVSNAIHCFMVAPMRANDTVIGALSVFRSTTPEEFTESDEQFLEDLADRAAQALANAHLHAQVVRHAQQNARLLQAERTARLALRDSEQRRREVLASMLETEEAERTRIATALHDDTVQVLVASLVALDRLPAAAAAGNIDQMAATAVKARQTLAEATERTRRLMFELRPTLLHDYGLAAATRVLLDETARETGASTRLDGEVGRYHLVLEEAVYRGVQEALANIRRHAEASEIAVRMHERAGMLVCEVIDDGRGFDPAEARARPQAALHIGLSHVAERMRAAGGELSIRSNPGRGTRLRMSVPVERRATPRG